MEALSILILDDEEGYRDGLKDLLSLRGHHVETAALPSEAKKILENKRFDLLLLDIGMPEMNGLDFLSALKKSNEDIEVIVITGHADMRHSVEALRAGASDFVTKPFHSIDIEHAIERTRKYHELANRLHFAEMSMAALNDELSTFVGTRIIGKSDAIHTILKNMKKVSEADDTTVLIYGESGTGKELVARGIHAMSKRKGQYFHSVNCAAVPETLFESEFFGYQKGAFTGAQETLPGWFEISNKGTLFLDEISGMPLLLQSKLLRVLDQKSITKLGSHKEIQLNLRITTATNMDLEKMVEDGKFRNDLYHRLATFKIHIPPLRERTEDIPLLAEHFRKMFNQSLGLKVTAIDDAALEALQQYHYPGNIRELKNMIERAFILGNGKRIQRKDLVIPDTHPPAREQKHQLKTLNLQDIEISAIKQAMLTARNNKSHAADLLGITRQALDRRMEKYGLTM
jgi:DNA-binding NtrC family response regulator